ncbi:MAG: hypothetical protein J0648_08460 [Pelodictyon phaeoclathratiforme]|nr:hypothetical protein [Pelodictyon phaeoclathratiforme]
MPAPYAVALRFVRSLLLMTGLSISDFMRDAKVKTRGAVAGNSLLPLLLKPLLMEL